MENIQIDTNRIIGLYAPQNYGKSYFARHIINAISGHIPVFVYDTNFEADTNYASMKNVFAIHSVKKSEMETPAFFNKAILTLRAKQSNFYLVIEDIDKLIETSHKTKDTLEIFKLASDSRHQRIGIIYLTKEPSNIPVKLRSNTNLFLVGQFLEPTHLKYLGEMVDRKIIKTLKKPEFILFDRLTQVIQKVKIENNKMVEL
jgi:hypothetical protein